jgi:hypothetical protein
MTHDKMATMNFMHVYSNEELGYNRFWDKYYSGTLSIFVMG